MFYYFCKKKEKNMNIIFARDLNGVIGKDNKLPWYKSEDLKYFKKITQNKICLAGRNTWLSIGKPLPHRICHLLSKSDLFDLPRFESLDEYYNLFKNEDVYLIGGPRLWQEALDKGYIVKVYETVLNEEYEGDIYFKFDSSNFNLIESNILNEIVFNTWLIK